MIKQAIIVSKTSSPRQSSTRYPTSGCSEAAQAVLKLPLPKVQPLLMLILLIRLGMASKSYKIIETIFNLPRYWSSKSEEHTSELQSRFDLVCRLLLEKNNFYSHNTITT